jgi:crossover junction endodeoxyribonuclease RuvC
MLMTFTQPRNHNKKMTSVPSKDIIVLGIDPGSTRAGYGVVVFSGRTPHYITAGIIATKQRDKNMLLADLDVSFKKLLKQTTPAIIGIEKLFFVNNMKTGLEVAQSRGVLLLSCAQQHLPIYEFTPKEIKQMIAGDGGADKKAIEKMVRITLGIDDIHQPDDAYDALAIALSAGYTHQRPPQLATR